MRRLGAAVLVGVFALLPSSGWGAAEAAGAHGVAARTTPDPCGFRYAVWPVVQQSANLVNDVADNTVSDTYTYGSRVDLLIEELAGMETDYDTPPGARPLANKIATVAGDLSLAVQKGSYDPNFGLIVSDAQKAQTKAWAIAGGICGWKGKAVTWMGYANKYGTDQGAISFSTPHAWTLRADYYCGSNSGNFIVDVNTASGSYVTTAANVIGKSGFRAIQIAHGGHFRVTVDSECAWHIKAAN